MSDLITDAMVETAAQIMWDTATGPGNWDELPEVGRDLERQAMRAALEAVAPLIAAEALVAYAELVMAPSCDLRDAATCRSIALDAATCADAIERGES